jgi:hypothetical protein
MQPAIWNSTDGGRFERLPFPRASTPAVLGVRMLGEQQPGAGERVERVRAAHLLAGTVAGLVCVQRPERGERLLPRKPTEWSERGPDAARLELVGGVREVVQELVEHHHSRAATERSSEGNADREVRAVAGDARPAAGPPTRAGLPRRP